jgi:hypothetical protein
VTKAAYLRWAGHVVKLEDARSAFEIVTVNLYQREFLGSLGTDGSTILK